MTARTALLLCCTFASRADNCCSARVPDAEQQGLVDTIAAPAIQTGSATRPGQESSTSDRIRRYLSILVGRLAGGRRVGLPWREYAGSHRNRDERPHARSARPGVPSGPAASGAPGGEGVRLRRQEPGW